MPVFFDIGSSKIRVASLAGGETLTEPLVTATPADGAPAVLEALAELVAELPQPVETLVGGVTRKIPLDAAQLTARFKVPAVVENDTALVGLGEAVRGAGRGQAIVVYITVSTGVGGVRVINGQIDQSRLGFEPGHQIINYLDPEKTLEDYVSGRAIERAQGQPPKTITDPELWSRLSQLVGYGVYNSILHWSPDMVVLGGGMFGSPGLSLPEVRQTVKQRLKIFSTCPNIVAAELGQFGGLHGAWELWRQEQK